MKEFTKEEVVQSLKDDSLHMTIVTALCLKDITQIQKDLQERNKSALTNHVTSFLNPEAIEELKVKSILDENNELTNLGLAHIQLFLIENERIKQMENGNIQAKQPENNTQPQATEEDQKNEIKAIIYLSLAEYSIEEITQLYNDRKEKTLTYYMTKNINGAGINKLLEGNIITLQNTITDAGWREIQNYIQLQKNTSSVKSTAKEINKPANNVELESIQPEKKWWKFW